MIATAAKLAGAHVPVETFEKIGLGQWLRYYTAGLELVFAILLVIPRTAALAAVLAAIMAGAVAAHLLVIGGSAASAAVPLLLAAALAWYRSRYE